MEDLYTLPTAMEPLTPGGEIFELEDLVKNLIEKASALSNSLHPVTRAAIADCLRLANSYYSNLIEGHDTHPLDIDKALKNDFTTNKRNKNLQLEARTHIAVHEKMVRAFEKDKINPYDLGFIMALHKDFYAHLPEEFRIAKSRENEDIPVEPGKLREREVSVGRHIAPGSRALSGFIRHFIEGYSPETETNRSAVRRIINIAASHHRLVWIHPFLDGNGRVVRLFSDACFMYENLHGSGLWSMSRGLARNELEYKQLLANADHIRMNDLDGRGNLSNRMLIDFCRFFLSVAIDQVEFMTKMLDIDHLLERIHRFVDQMVIEKKLATEARYVLEFIFLKGSVPKREVERLTGKSDKPAKQIADSLLSMGLLKTDKTNRLAPYEAAYSIPFSPVIFSGLYPKAKEIDMLTALKSQ